MLLKHTTAEVTERKALTVNPAKTCQPVGAMYAALGVHKCPPHSHGSQGCCSYHRSALTRHYKEPVMAATSSFTEGSSVFGGQSNLVQAINTIFTVYDPEIIAVHSTCLSETIGDDLLQICTKASDDGKVPEGKYVVSAPTPSYVGSHVTGFANMVEGFVKGFAKSSDKKTDKINILPGWVEPSDMAEMKRIADMMGVSYTMLPDTSGVLDAPQTGKHVMYPKGGTKREDIVEMGDNKSTLACGHFSSQLAAKKLDTMCKVPYEETMMPFGVGATDDYVMALAKMAGVEVPDSITDERGRLVDMITDMQANLYGKRVALYGDPDWLLPMCRFLVELDMKPVYVVTGTPGKYFDQEMEKILGEKVPEAKYKSGAQADMFLLHQWIKEEGVDLLIGNTYGKYISRDDNIPFLRMGFPIYDRVGHADFAKVGYKGSLSVLTDIINLLLDHRDETCTEEKFELVL